MASERSANAGSNVFRGKVASPETLFLAASRKDDREDGRSGVVGRDVRVRDVERARFVLESRPSPPIFDLSYCKAVLGVLRQYPAL